MKGLLLYNPMAGRFPSELMVARAASQLDSHGWEIEIVKTQGGSHLTSLAEEAASADLDIVIVAGGDGSLQRAASGLLGSQTALGVLPAGTANVWAQELGLPVLSWTNWTALEDSAARLLDGEIRVMDVGICRETPFLLWSGAGLDAFLVHHLEPRPRWAKGIPVPHYAANLARLSLTWPGMKISLVVDGKEISGQYILALVTNIHLYAGGLAEISPAARIDDGKMDLWLFKGESMWETLQHVVDLAYGNHLDSDAALQIGCREIQIISDQDLYLQVDGEPIPPARNVLISLQPQALRVLVPRDLPRKLFVTESA